MENHPPAVLVLQDFYRLEYSSVFVRSRQDRAKKTIRIHNCRHNPNNYKARAAVEFVSSYYQQQLEWSKEAFSIRNLFAWLSIPIVQRQKMDPEGAVERRPAKLSRDAGDRVPQPIHDRGSACITREHPAIHRVWCGLDCALNRTLVWRRPHLG